MNKFFKCLLGTVAYWFLFFGGPVLINLWNNLSYYVSGLGYGPGSLMYKALEFVSQPTSCFFALLAASKICGEEHDRCTLVNCVLGTILAATLTVYYMVSGNNNTQLWIMVFSTISCVCTVIVQANNLSVKSKLKISTSTKRILITLSLWLIVRGLPQFLLSEFVWLNVIMYFGAALLGWFVATKISDGETQRCIRVNFWIFFVIEFLGIFSTFSTFIYSDNLFNSLLITGSSIGYVVLCYKLIQLSPDMEKNKKVLPEEPIDEAARAKNIEIASANEKKFKKFSVVVVAILLMFFVFIAGYAFGTGVFTDTVRTATPTVSEPVEAPVVNLVKYKRPMTEEFTNSISEKRLAPISLTAKQDADCYCVLERTSGTYGTIKFFVRKGETIKLSVPLGTYKLYFATGDTWYGRQNLYGPNGKYYELNMDFTFKEETNEYIGWKVDLARADESNCYSLVWDEMP